MKNLPLHAVVEEVRFLSEPWCDASFTKEFPGVQLHANTVEALRWVKPHADAKLSRYMIYTDGSYDDSREENRKASWAFVVLAMGEPEKQSEDDEGKEGEEKEEGESKGEEKRRGKDEGTHEVMYLLGTFQGFVKTDGLESLGAERESNQSAELVAAFWATAWLAQRQDSIPATLLTDSDSTKSAMMAKTTPNWHKELVDDLAGMHELVKTSR